MKKFLACFLIILSISILFTACSPNDKPSSDNDINDKYSTEEKEVDTVTIKNVESDNDVIFVTVSYHLVSVQEAELMIGSMDPDSGYFQMLNTEVYVQQGNGEYTFTVLKTELYSGELYVNISEYPHASTWFPLDTDEYTLDDAAFEQ